MPGGNLEQKGKLIHTRPTETLDKEIGEGNNRAPGETCRRNC